MSPARLRFGREAILWPQETPMKLKTLATLPPDQKRRAVATLVTASLGPPNGQMTELDARLVAFEGKYGMSTEVMIAAFKAGKVEDSADFAHWLVLAKARGG